MNCYRIEEIQGSEPLFQHIDATYVLHLENNGRIDRIKKEVLMPLTGIIMNKKQGSPKRQLTIMPRAVFASSLCSFSAFTHIVDLTGTIMNVSNKFRR